MGIDDGIARVLGDVDVLGAELSPIVCGRGWVQIRLLVEVSINCIVDCPHSHGWMDQWMNGLMDQWINVCRLVVQMMQTHWPLATVHCPMAATYYPLSAPLGSSE